jgi:NitT/TauT family transport system substrate-binding protein
MKKIMKIIVLLMLLLGVVSGCNKETDTLRLGTMPTYSAAIYAVGIEKEFFKDAGIEVELTVFRSARDRDAAATAGELDGFMTDIMGAVNLNAKGFPFIMTSREYEDFGVMAGIDVNKKSVMLPKTGIADNTVTEYIVDTYITQKIEKVNIIAVPDRMGALLSGELSYGVFPQPFMGIIEEKGGQLVFNTASEEFYPVVLVFDETYMNEKEASIKAFYEGYIKTVEYMQSVSYDDYKEALVTYTLATEETVDLYKLPVAEYGLNSVDEKTFNSIVTWMKEKELLDIEMNFNSIQSSNFSEE